MNKSNHIHIIDDFLNSESAQECDLRRISYHIVSQGIREAEYHAYKNRGEKRENYRQTMLFLEQARDDIEEWFSDGSSFGWKHFIALKEVFEISDLLIKIKYNEERQYSNALSQAWQQNLCKLIV